MSDLAIAYGVKKRNKYAKGGLIKDQDIDVPMKGIQEKGNEYEPEIEDEMPAEPMEEVMPAKENLPSMMMAKGGMMPSKKIVHMIMLKKANGGMINQGDNMPVNDDIDNFSAETSSEGPLDEGMYEEDREDKIMGRKKMLGSIMARLHSDNKG